MKNLKNTVWVHYGSDKFDKTKFKIIYETKFGFPTKPHPKNGLWASKAGKKNYKYSWKWYSDIENFMSDSKIANKFFFKIKEYANIMWIENKADYVHYFKQHIPKNYFDKWLDGKFKWNFDWNSIIENYDGIYVAAGGKNKLIKFLFQGFDCDSINIFNPDIVIPVEYKAEYGY